MRVVWQCESDPWARAVLARHWPGVPCYPDVAKLAGADIEPVDVLCGGFPCQGLSDAGLRLGLLDPRSGLWSEFARLIRELHPGWVVVENVPGLLVRGMGRVLGDLAASGYDAEWDCLPASAFGAPHRRDRVWIVAYPAAAVADPEVEPVGPGLRSSAAAAVRQRRPRHGGRPAGADADGLGQQGRLPGFEAGGVGQPRRVRDVPDADGFEPRLRGRDQQPTTPGPGRHLHQWAAEPDVGRVADGVPARVDRLRGLGNSLVPQIAEWIGGRIMTWENAA